MEQLVILFLSEFAQKKLESFCLGQSRLSNSLCGFSPLNVMRVSKFSCPFSFLLHHLFLALRYSASRHYLRLLRETPTHTLQESQPLRYLILQLLTRKLIAATCSRTSAAVLEVPLFPEVSAMYCTSPLDVSPY